ncbi:MAG TPA: hypothetical protein VGD40_15420, partial [Chryseosolibacter sp.]
LSFPTHHQAGINDVSVFVNPRVLPENDFDNNFITLVQHVKVLPDTLAPLLEVTFDGRFIEQHEFVSPQSEIKVVVVDNNPFLFLQDTTGMQLYLQTPCIDGACAFRPVYFSSAEITWSAETADSEFEVQFRPNLAAEGTYVLRVVAADVSGNKSGGDPFEIAFNVAYENLVTIKEPYPNPFTDRAIFELEISGESVPSEIEMILFNTRGEIVRRFDHETFGQLHIGKNVFIWEGLNQKGIPVPNGIYIFKMLVRSDAGVTEKVGKLILIR